MFLGSIPQTAQSIVLESVRGWRPGPIQVLCSGNLTVERTLAPLGWPLLGNDITIYSCVLGAAAAGMELELTIADEFQDEWGWLQESLDGSPYEKAATVALLTRFVHGLNRPDHPYWSRMHEGHRRQWGTVFPKTVEKMRQGLPSLEAFHIDGALEVLERCEESVIAFPPFFPGDYESMFRKLAKLVRWPEPAFRPLDKEGRAELIERTMQRDQWMGATRCCQATTGCRPRSTLASRRST